MRLFFVCLLFAFSAFAKTNPTCNELLNGTALDRARFFNGQLNEQLAVSPNRAMVEKLIEETLPNEPLITMKLSETEKLKSVRRNIKSNVEIVLESKGEEKVLFSMSTLSKNQSLNAVAFKLSPDRNLLAIVFEENGSTDKYSVAIVNLKNNKVIDQFDVDDQRLYWETSTELLVEKKKGLARWRKETKSTARIRMKEMRTFKRAAVMWNDDRTIAINQDEEKFELDTGSLSIEGISGLLADGRMIVERDDNALSVIKFPKDSDTAEMHAFYKPKERIIDDVIVLPRHVAVASRWGADRWVELLNDEGEHVQTIRIPDCCDLEDVTWEREGESLNLSLSSMFSHKQKFVFDLKSQSFLDRDLEDKMMTYKGIQMITEVVEVTSEDGTVLPMRITHRKDAVRNGKNGALIQAYGGFGRPGYIEPSFNPLNAEFVLRGNIYAAPALRGGDEFGPEWHEAAVRKGKIHTMEDMIAAERWMTSSGWSRPSKIVTRGTSNGGFVIASSALLAPDAIGLAIPVSGVLDVLNIRKKDPRFARYWGASDYGNAAKRGNSSWIAETSPVELAKTATSIPRILAVDGLNDSRVNHAHSDVFIQELLRNPSPEVREKVSMLSLKNAGHWLESITYQGMIGYRTNVVIWTMIYDFLGMNSAPSEH